MGTNQTNNIDIEKIIGRKIIEQSSLLNLSNSWYRSDVKDFHNYMYRRDGFTQLMHKKSLHMAKLLCERMANLHLNERCNIIIDKDKDKLDKVLRKNKFWLRINNGIETVFALGIGALVENVVGLKIGEKSKLIDKTKGEVKIEFVNAFKIHPVTIKDHEITECVFESRGSATTNLVFHEELPYGKYMIHNYVVDNKDGEVINEYMFPVARKLFQILKPNIVNNTDLDNDLGISIYANSFDAFEMIDNIYDGMDLEFKLSQRRMYISDEATRVSLDGTKVEKSYDPSDALIFHLSKGPKDEPFVESVADPIRDQAYINAINTVLNIISSNVGLGENFFKFQGGTAVTATQVISEQSEAYRTIKKNNILFEQSLIEMTEAIIYLTNEFTNEPIAETEEVIVHFDDSIIEDKGAEIERDRADVASGIMSVEEYRMKHYGESEDEAKKNVPLETRINKYLPALTQGAMTPKQFMEIVYQKNYTEEDLKYVEEYIKSSPQQDMIDVYETPE